MELWQPIEIAVAVMSIIVIVLVLSLTVILRYYASRTADTDNCPPYKTRPGDAIKTVQEGHDQNIHSQTHTECINDSMMAGRNDATFRYSPTGQEEVRGLVPIRAGNGFDSFIRDYVIPTFCRQRRDKQFAVLFLSKHDECNIHKTQFGESSSYKYMILQL
jgi:hypothetical protein